MKIKAIIVDDERAPRELLRQVIGISDEDIEIIGEGNSLPDAVRLIYELSPDIVFLDINMPGYSGLQIADFLKEERDFEIIFVTAYDKYAIDAIRLSAFDYLLKPIQPDDLKRCMDRYKNARSRDSHLKERLQTLQDNVDLGPKKILVHSQNGVDYLEIADILYLEASGMYTVFHKIDGTEIVASKPLKEFEKILEKGFFRSHRSYLVNISRVKRYENESGLLLLEGNKKVALARQQKSEFMKLFQA